MNIEEFEKWIVVCSERLGSEPCQAIHFAADVRSRVEDMIATALLKLSEEHALDLERLSLPVKPTSNA